MAVVLRNMTYPILRTRDHFEYWLFDMSFVLDYFRDSLPARVRNQLDYSPASLDALETWLLDRYPSHSARLERYELTRTDDIGRYIGETFRRTLGGAWDVILDSPNNAWFEMPYLQGSPERPYSDCPFFSGTAAANRRTGKYLRTILENMMSRYGLDLPR